MTARTKAIRDTSRITLRYAFAFGAVIAVAFGVHGLELLSHLH
ncbi:MAG: hypothetical protein ACREFD_19960 [Stellaceae bacterium]